MAQNNKIKSMVTQHYTDVFNGLRYALNHYPLKRRIVFAWRILRGKF